MGVTDFTKKYEDAKKELPYERTGPNIYQQILLYQRIFSTFNPTTSEASPKDTYRSSPVTVVQTSMSENAQKIHELTIATREMTDSITGIKVGIYDKYFYKNGEPLKQPIDGKKRYYLNKLKRAIENYIEKTYVGKKSSDNCHFF